jgi:tetratricopeptide (TPR) repeat protein
MFAGDRLRPLFIYALVSLTVAICFHAAVAQGDDAANGETDPVKVFEKGQDAHAKADYKLAIQLYDAAIKLKPEFAEAEFQRAMALLATKRKSEAIAGFNRAVSERPDWGLAYAKFGIALARDSSSEALPILRKAIELNDKNLETAVEVAFAFQRAGARDEAVKTIRAATMLKDATGQTWQQRSFFEAAAGDNGAAMSSITHALELEPNNPSMHYDRARLSALKQDKVTAIAELDLARASFVASPNTPAAVILDVARLYGNLGKPEAGLNFIDAFEEKTGRQLGAMQLRAELAMDAGKAEAQDLNTLEQILQAEPNNTALLSRLGNAYRRADPVKSQNYYYRALQLEPKNPKYATGYAAALVQQRQFAQAEPILKGVIVANPDDSAAHANLALALYEMKRFAEAIHEYEWLAAANPDIAATYFFIATAHDNLGEYPQALEAYETFLSHASAAENKLEIDKVNLRLPALRAQIQRGQGVKPKKP